MGAWIETSLIFRKWNLEKVAPCVGAWIETKNTIGEQMLFKVAPCVGAWIETHDQQHSFAGLSRRTLRGCVD